MVPFNRGDPSSLAVFPSPKSASPPTTDYPPRPLICPVPVALLACMRSPPIDGRRNEFLNDSFGKAIFSSARESPFFLSL